MKEARVIIDTSYLAVGTVAAPWVGAAAVLYGLSEMGSYAITGKSLEDNIFGP